MEHSKELQAALEEMEQLQDRISLLKTMAHAAPQDIDSGNVVAPDRLWCAAPCRMRLVAAAAMATAPNMATATKASRVGVSGPDVDDDVARVLPDLGPRRRSSRDTVSMALTSLTDLARTTNQCKPFCGNVLGDLQERTLAKDYAFEEMPH